MRRPALSLVLQRDYFGCFLVFVLLQRMHFSCFLNNTLSILDYRPACPKSPKTIPGFPCTFGGDPFRWKCRNSHRPRNSANGWALVGRVKYRLNAGHLVKSEFQVNTKYCMGHMFAKNIFLYSWNSYLLGPCIILFAKSGNFLGRDVNKNGFVGQGVCPSWCPRPLTC